MRQRQGEGRSRLLVVDDEQIILDLLVRTFSPLYEVHAAPSGTLALEVLAQQHIDLLITDQKMPGMTGIELIGAARKIQPDLHSILLTAYSDPEDLIAAINEQRVFRYLAKPWNTPDLILTVRNALEAVNLRKERHLLHKRMERRLNAMGVLVEISAQAGAPQSYGQLLELITRALPRILAFDVAAMLVVPPGAGGPGPAVMHIHCGSSETAPTPAAADEGMLLSARDRALDIYNQLVAAERLAIDQDELLVNITGPRVRSDEDRRGHVEIRSSLHLPILSPGAQGGVVGLLYVASLTPNAFTDDEEENLGVLASQTAELVRRLSARMFDERRKMELMVESMADGLIMTDQTGEVFLLNPAARRMLGLDGAEAPITARFLKERLGFYPFDLVRTRGRAEPVREELKLGPNFLHSIVSPVLDAVGVPVGVVVVLRDISEQKALEQRKEEFVSIVSHELRTPLTSISGALDIVLSQYVGGLTDKQARYLEMARESCTWLNTIVDDLLDVAKLERGKLSMKMGSADVGELVREAAERFRPAAEGKRIAIAIRAPETIRIVADADRLAQVLSNLLSNAVKFTPEGGSIQLDVFGPETSRTHVGIAVWNNGVGIAEADRERIFDKFEQVQSSSTRQVGGTGLGLAISRSIVEGHGGRIWVEEAPVGARFVLVLPLLPPEKIADSDAPKHSSTVRTVLVVDDDHHATWIIKGMLMTEGLRAIVAHDSESALALAREKRPDALTVDLRMPEVDGPALVEILRHDPDTRKTPIIVLSVTGHSDGRAASFSDAQLRKPVEAHKLADVVGRLIADRGRLRKKILCVDDDPGIRMICREVLERQGFRVSEAADGHEALIEAQRWKPDLILVDVMMPGMDGFALAQRLRADRETSMTPIIFVSARGQTADKVRAFRLGAEDYLVKPFDSAELVARADKALMRREIELGASPTTRLPGSVSIEEESSRRMAQSSDFAFCYLDLDNLKAFNDYYGYAKADGVILQTADILREVLARLGGPGDFVGHIAGDDFVFLTTVDYADRVCVSIIETFDRLVPLYYNKSDRERGYIETLDRFGVMRRFPIMSVSIACVTRTQAVSNHADLSRVAAELKQKAKAITRSSYVRDGRVLWPPSESANAAS